MAPAKTHQTSLVHLATALLAACLVELSRPPTTPGGRSHLPRHERDPRPHAQDDRGRRHKRLSFLHPGLRSIADDRVESLTGQTPGKELPGILARLRRPHGDDEAVDAALATNMLSVGVDIRVSA